MTSPVQLDRGKVSVLLPADAYISESACGAPRFEGESGYMFALLRRGVEAVDVVAGGVVEEVGFGGGDVVTELPVSNAISSAPCSVTRLSIAEETHETGIRSG